MEKDLNVENASSICVLVVRMYLKIYFGITLEELVAASINLSINWLVRVRLMEKYWNARLVRSSLSQSVGGSFVPLAKTFIVLSAILGLKIFLKSLEWC